MYAAVAGQNQIQYLASFSLENVEYVSHVASYILTLYMTVELAYLL